MRLLLFVILMSFFFKPGFAHQYEGTAYPLYYGTIVRIIDGDTLVVKLDLWPSITGKFSVRVRGIDAPDIRKVDCENERIWGEEAKNKVIELYDPGSKVRLENVVLDSFGRVLADISRYRSDRWLYLKEELINRKLAVEWHPNMKDVPWCLLAETR